MTDYVPGAPLRPEVDIPELPLQVTDLTEEDLTNLMAEFTVWSDFAWAMVTESRIKEESASISLQEAEGRALIANWKGGTDARVAVAKATVATDEDVIASRKIFGEAKAKRTRYESLAERLDRDAALLSRELTRRTSIQPVRKTRWIP